ncbi:MAG: GNAT family N-acetyltransferase [Pseudobutyrivibrio ruminis]|nr:GNAT family N-acetyltransferase [Pseudobutyrivibrio ruminis]
MLIRRSQIKDIDKLITLLQEVLEIHSKIRPDIFISGTTKYTREELLQKIANDDEPIYVAVDDNDEVIGYAFCVLKQQPFSTNMVPFTSLYIDDLCVDSKYRGQHIGEQLFEYVKAEAKRFGCYEITLAVWAGNDGAEKFYDRIGLKTKERIMEYIL